LLNELDTRGLNTSIFVTGDMSVKYPLYITLIGSKNNHELALAGKTTDEKLEALPSSEQYIRMARAKSDVESNYVCGENIVAVKGYLPQPSAYNSSNMPYKLMEDLELDYFISETTQGGWPYNIENRSIYAVPLARHYGTGGLTGLSDRSAEAEGLNGSQWKDLLFARFNETSDKGEPLIAIFHNFISGSGDYLDAYKQFIEHLNSKNARFVTSEELVNLTKTK
jgi:peptidoglycan/xylan/chitin deacetylase (PgdA/CDA1 family)